MKEIKENEGFDPYNILPDEYASAERFLHKYLCNDEKILDLVGSDGDDTVGHLFVRFVENELRNHGLSIEDVGVRRSILKRQFASWENFPRAFTQDNPTALHYLSDRKDLFAWMQIDICSKENPHKKMVKPG